MLNPLSASPDSSGIFLRRTASPFEKLMPYPPSNPRVDLLKAVRSLKHWERIRWMACMLCSSTVLTETNDIWGLSSDSQWPAHRCNRSCSLALKASRIGAALTSHHGPRNAIPDPSSEMLRRLPCRRDKVVTEQRTEVHGCVEALVS